MPSEILKTSVSWVDPDRILIRGYRMRDLIGRVNFGQLIYLLLTGDLPEPKVGRLIEAILVAAADQGPNSPSARATVTVADAGASLSAAVAAGVLAITRYHGGAIEDCMQLLEESVQMDLEPFEAATEVVNRYQRRGVEITGFRVRDGFQDPRVPRLLEYGRELGLAGAYVDQLHAFEKALSQAWEAEVAADVDGAIAALLCETRFPRHAANGLFLISRVAGLVAHAVEHKFRYKPMYAVEAYAVEYDGPPERKLPPWWTGSPEA